MAIPIIFTLKDPDKLYLTFWLIEIAILSDTLDGWVARKSHGVTHLGQWLDPIADFIVILAVQPLWSMKIYSQYGSLLFT
ncbi:MAG: hypothetical protein CM1200mP10_32800 [Candidatus Neomarinimicrobiota bacterium]|nr:MAG: hypothetical protein CM1200mP10_32800 [Candidatus Neomarinimicrobiota bacterium]